MANWKQAIAHWATDVAGYSKATDAQIDKQFPIRDATNKTAVNSFAHAFATARATVHNGPIMAAAMAHLREWGQKPRNDADTNADLYNDLIGEEIGTYAAAHGLTSDDEIAGLVMDALRRGDLVIDRKDPRSASADYPWNGINPRRMPSIINIPLLPYPTPPPASPPALGPRPDRISFPDRGGNSNHPDHDHDPGQGSGHSGLGSGNSQSGPAGGSASSRQSGGFGSTHYDHESGHPWGGNGFGTGDPGSVGSGIHGLGGNPTGLGGVGTPGSGSQGSHRHPGGTTGTAIAHGDPVGTTDYEHQSPGGNSGGPPADHHFQGKEQDDNVNSEHHFHGKEQDDNIANGPGYGLTSPVVLDLSGDGISITELTSSNVFFDAAGDGYKHRMAWAGVGDGVLAIDADGDGQITERQEIIFTDWEGRNGVRVDNARRRTHDR